jgi:hypothetical protein
LFTSVSFLKNAEVAQILRTLFSKAKVTKCFHFDWATFWAIFFTNSPGHPGVYAEDAPALPKMLK